MPPLHVLKRNIKLASSWSIIFAFIINPILSVGWFSLTCNTWFRGLFPFGYHHMRLAIYYTICSTTVIPLLATHGEEKRLKELGWEMKSTWLEELEFWSWAALCYGYQYWVSEAWGEEGPLELYIIGTITRCLAIYLGLVLGHLGRLWWFLTWVPA